MPKFSMPANFQPENISTLAKAHKFLEQLHSRSSGNVIGFEEGKKHFFYESPRPLEQELISYIAKLPKNVRPIYDFSVLTMTDTNGIITNIFLVGLNQVAIELHHEEGDRQLFLFDGDQYSPVCPEEFEQFKNSLEDFIETRVFKEIRQDTQEKVGKIVKSELDKILPEILKKEIDFLRSDAPGNFSESISSSTLENIKKIMQLMMEYLGLAKMNEILKSKEPFYKYRLYNKFFYEIGIAGDMVKYLVLNLENGSIEESVQCLKSKILNDKNPILRIRTGNSRH